MTKTVNHWFFIIDRVLSFNLKCNVINLSRGTCIHDVPVYEIK